MYEVNDILTLRKPHPCGGTSFQVTRVGADIKIRCETCGKYLNLTRDDLKKRVKEKRTESKQ